MEVILKGTVSFQGKDRPAGDVLDLPERSAKCLVDAGVAGYVPEQAPVSPPGGEKDEKSSLLPDGDLVAQEDEVARLTKALEDQYKRDELADAAKIMGVEFKYDAKKAEIVAASIEQGKAAALLK